MFEEKLKTQDLLYGLRDYKKILNNLVDQGKEYDSFLKDLLRADELIDSDRIVYIKKVAQQLNISSIKIRRYLELIHDDIIEFLCSDDRLPIKTNTSICSISIKDKYNKCFYIGKIELDIIPREGETIDIPFLFHYFRYTYFEVNKIYHRIDFDVHEIHLELRNKLNRYVRLKDDEDDYKKNREYYDDEMSLFHKKHYYTFKRGEWKER
jgi:hypothetical protein